jgi:lactate dehydrogenase-like 2-hydroxyacid dehydrogenase
MEREIGRLEGHFIICGMGRVGRSVARELGRKPVPFVMIENAEIKRQRFAHENWLVISGDATLEETLRQAQIESLYCADGARAQSSFEDHRPCERGRGREASVDRWC